MSSLKKLVAIGFLVIGVTGGSIILFLAINGASQEPVKATILPMPRPLPDFALLDHQGQPYTRENFRGGWQIVFFGFTNCPDICPATLQQLSIARDRVIADGGQFPQIVLVSVDPERDSPDVLRRYVANFGDDVVGVTGEMAELKKLTRPLGIYLARSGEAGSNYNVDHSSFVLLIDSAAEWRALFGPPQNVASFVHDVPLLMDAG
ncbi:MAG: SCO family protein [Woeseiaceae bacterium]|nr:SCO family protein [Woeseiaceae bacterium]